MWTFTSKLNPFITALFCLIPFATAPYLTAQANFTAQLRGVVKDESGGIVPGAKVAIENEATGVATTAVATGFAKLVQSGVTLRVSQQSSLDLQLKIGSTTSSVDVKANAVLLNSDNGELGQEITSR